MQFVANLTKLSMSAIVIRITFIKYQQTQIFDLFVFVINFRMERKTLIGIGVGAFLLGTALLIYHNYKSTNTSQQTQTSDKHQDIVNHQKPEDLTQSKLQDDCDCMKSTSVNSEKLQDHKQLTLEDLTKLCATIQVETNKRQSQLINSCRRKRLQFLNRSLDQYFQQAKLELLKFQEIQKEIEGALLKESGVSEQDFQYGLMKFPEILDLSQKLPSKKKLSLKQIKQVLSYQKQLLNRQGSEIFFHLKTVAMEWSQSQKQLLDQIVNILLSDFVFVRFGYNQEQVQNAQEQFKKQLVQDISELRWLLTDFLYEFNQDPQKIKQARVTGPMVSESNENTSVSDRLRLDLTRSLSGSYEFSELMDIMHTS